MSLPLLILAGLAAYALSSSSSQSSGGLQLPGTPPPGSPQGLLGTVPPAGAAASTANALLSNPNALMALLGALVQNPQLAAQLAQNAPQLAQLAQALMQNPALASQVMQIAAQNPQLAIQLAQLLASNPALMQLALQALGGAQQQQPAAQQPAAQQPVFNQGGTQQTSAGNNPLAGLLQQLGGLGQQLGGLGQQQGQQGQQQGAQQGNPLQAILGGLGGLLGQQQGQQGQGPAPAMPVPGGHGGQQSPLDYILGALGQQNAQGTGPYQGSGIHRGGFGGQGIPGYGGIDPRTGQGQGPGYGDLIRDAFRGQQGSSFQNYFENALS